jgi:hypothetical protein
MSFAVVFSLIGNELRIAGHAKPGQPGLVTEGARIVIGGTIATALLALLTEAGDAGAKLGVGLALVTFTTATLVYGGPVWNALGKIVGSTTAGNVPTTPTTPTTPTKGLT